MNLLFSQWEDNTSIQGVKSCARCGNWPDACQVWESIFGTMTAIHSRLEAMGTSEFSLDVFNAQRSSGVRQMVDWLIVLGPSSP